MRSQHAHVLRVERTNETILKMLTHLRFALFKIMRHLLRVVLHSVNSLLL